MTLHRNKSPRAAFTLLELLVVIGIIALLATITVSAVFHLREGQTEVNTSRDLRKIHIGLEQQWKAAVDTINTKEKPSDKLLDACKNSDGSRNNDRAKALHLKLRLRQEFPQTFAEFRSAVANFPEYNPKQLYQKALGPNWTGVKGRSPEEESAVLLLLILSQGRGGIEFNTQDVATVQTRSLSDGTQVRVLVDRWSNPISFRRWALDTDPVLGELNQPPFVDPKAPANKYDPQDPDAKLQGNWQNKDAWINEFAKYFPQGSLTYPAPFDGMNRGPFVFSFGKDGNPMTADDLFSFRLQSTGRGN